MDANQITRVEIPCGQSIIWVFDNQKVEFAATPPTTAPPTTTPEGVVDLLPPPTPEFYDAFNTKELKYIAMTHVDDTGALADIVDNMPTEWSADSYSIEGVDILYYSEE